MTQHLYTCACAIISLLMETLAFMGLDSCCFHSVRGVSSHQSFSRRIRHIHEATCRRSVLFHLTSFFFVMLKSTATPQLATPPLLADNYSIILLRLPLRLVRVRLVLRLELEGGVDGTKEHLTVRNTISTSIKAV